MQSIQDVWDGALNYMKEELSPLIFKEYIEPIEPLYYAQDTIILKLDEFYKRNLIENRYNGLVLNALRFSTGGRNINIKYVLDDSEYREPAMAALNEMYGYTPSQMNFNPRYTFDTFVVGSNNRLAHAASLAVAQYPAQKYNPLFIYGGVGLGKTHLIQAIAQYVLHENPKKRIVYVSSEKFTNDFIDAIRRETNIQFRNKYRNVDMLLIDDIQFVAGKEGTQEEFFHTFNDLYNAGKQIIITSDKPPKDIPNLEERLRTRFESGLSCDISPPNFETRVAILKKKSEEESLFIKDEVLEFIAENMGSNIRELEGILLKLKMIIDLEEGSLTNHEIIEQLGDIITVSEKRINIELIIQATAKFYNISYADILSAKRTMNIANARQVAMYLTREMTDLSLPSIGDSFGGRNHSTVIHACTKVREDQKINTSLKNEVSQIISNIKNTNN